MIDRNQGSPREPGSEATLHENLEGQHLAGGSCPAPARAHERAQGTERAKETLKNAGEELRDKAHQAGERLRAEGLSFAARQRDHFAEELDAFGSAVDDTARKLRDEGNARVGDYAEVLSDKLRRAGRYLQGRDVEALVRDGRELVRRRPGLMYGSMFAAGFALSRFFKASGRRAAERETEASRAPGFAGASSQAGSLPAEPREAIWDGRSHGSSRRPGEEAAHPMEGGSCSLDRGRGDMP